MSVARNVWDLVPIAVDAVVLAFRTGLLATQVRDSLEQETFHTSSWSVVIPGIQEEPAIAALQEFVISEVSGTRQDKFLYLSVLGLTPITPTLH